MAAVDLGDRGQRTAGDPQQLTTEICYIYIKKKKDQTYEGEGLRDLAPRRCLAGERERDLDLEPERLLEDLDRLCDLKRINV